MIQNTTDIPDSLLVFVASFVMPKTSDGRNPPISVLEVKNKKNGKVSGQWGWWYPDEKRVVLIVPRSMPRYRTHLRFSKREITFNSRAEWLVATMAHELRHAWQYASWNTEMSRWKLEHTRIGKYAREVDAELYELAQLERWRKEVTT